MDVDCTPDSFEWLLEWLLEKSNRDTYVYAFIELGYTRDDFVEHVHSTFPREIGMLVLLAWFKCTKQKNPNNRRRKKRKTRNTEGFWSE